MWCIDMGDEFPAAEVIGVDLSPIQPTWVPPNVYAIAFPPVHKYEDLGLLTRAH